MRTWVLVGIITVALGQSLGRAEIIEQNPWNTLSQAGWGNYGGTIDDTIDAPDGETALKYTYLEGHLAGRSAGKQEYAGGVIDGRTELYVGFWFKYSSNWYWAGGNKLSYHYARHSVTGSQARSWFIAVGDRRLKMDNQPGFLPVTSYRYNACSGCQNPTLQTNTWYWLEYRIKLNTATTTGYTANGIFEMWLNGTKVMSHTNVPYRDTSHWTLHRFQQYASWGGNTGITKPATDFLWFDLTTFSTSRIGYLGIIPPSAPGGLVVQ